MSRMFDYTVAKVVGSNPGMIFKIHTLARAMAIPRKQNCENLFTIDVLVFYNTFFFSRS